MFEAMRRTAAGLGVLWLCLGTAAADPITAGPQPAPPVRPSQPELTQQLAHRRNVRGCPVEDDCMSADDVLRQFEAERMPPPGHDPWISERTPPASKLEAGKP